MHHRGTLQLFQYWTQQRAGRGAPRRADIAPAAVSTLLGNMFILEGALDQAIFRLAGTRLCSAFGRELKGLGLIDIFVPHERSLIIRALDAVVAKGDLVVGEVVGDNGADGKLNMELLLLPLSDGDPRILGSLQFIETPYWIGSQPIGGLELVTLKHADPDQELVSLANRPPLILPEQRDGGMRARMWHVLDGGRSDTDLKERDRRNLLVIHGGRQD